MTQSNPAFKPGDRVLFSLFGIGNHNQKLKTFPGTVLAVAPEGYPDVDYLVELDDKFLIPNGELGALVYESELAPEPAKES